MIVYSNQEIKKIYDQVFDMKDFWRVTNLLMNICEEYPEQKTIYLYQISIIKYKNLRDNKDNNELEVV